MESNWIVPPFDLAGEILAGDEAFEKDTAGHLRVDGRDA